MILDMDDPIDVSKYTDVSGEKVMMHLPHDAFAVWSYQRFMVGIKTFRKFAQHLPGCKVYLRKKCTCGLDKAKEESKLHHRKF